MELPKLLNIELICKKYYKPFDSILHGSSILLYYIDIRDEYIELIKNTQYNPIRMINNLKYLYNDNVNIIWKYWMLNKLIFSLSICNLSSSKQLFIIFNGLRQ